MARLYIVSSSKGLWDDYVKFVVGVGTTPEWAEDLKQQYLRKLALAQSKYTPKENVQLEKLSNKTDVLHWSQEVSTWAEWQAIDGEAFSQDVSIREVEENEFLIDSLIKF